MGASPEFGRRRFLFPRQKNSDPSLNQPTDTQPVSRFWNQLRDRRRFVRDAVLISGIASVSGIAITVATHLKELGEVWAAFQNRDNLQAANEAKDRLMKVIDSYPNEDALEAATFNRGAKIDLRQEQNSKGNHALDLDVIVVGDSDTYLYGTKDDHAKPPTSQPHSFAQIAVDALDANETQKLGVNNINVYTYAVPGAPSGNGFWQEGRKYGILSEEQLFNEDALNRLRNGDQLKEFVYVATGDDFREVVSDAAQLASVFSSLEDWGKITKDQVNQLSGLIEKARSISEQYGKNVATAAAIVGEINKERIAAGKPGIKFTVAHPWSLRYQDRIPFKALSGDNKLKGLQGFIEQDTTDPNETDRYFLNIDKIPNGHKIAYVPTAEMRMQLNTVLPHIAAAYPDLEIVPLEWMGLNKQENFYAMSVDGKVDPKGDGHPGPLGGIQSLGQAWLDLHLASENVTLGTYAKFPSHIA